MVGVGEFRRPASRDAAMTRPGPDIPRYDSLRASRRALGRVAPWVRFGLFSVGVSLFYEQVEPLVSDVQLTWAERRIAGALALAYLGSFGIAGWVAGKLLSTGAELIDVMVDQSESAARTANLIEQHALPALGRIAVALEKLAAGEKPDPAQDERTRAIEAARRVIVSGRWAQADRLVGAFVRDHPGPDAARLLAELTDARNRAVYVHRARLDAARQAGDALLAIEIRDALTEHLKGEPLADLDRDLVRWLVGEIKKRIRAGTVKPDVATLAARIVDSFADTTEGAALRASIPNLRRSAGLCPRCARPYRGSADACPRCLGNPSTPSPAPVPLAGDPDPEESR